MKSGEEEVTVEPLRSALVCTLDFASAISADNRREVILIAELWRENERIALNVATFVPNKHLALSEPALTVEIRPQDHELVFNLSAKSLARFVEVSLAGVDVVFSDNYFDVPAGRTVNVSCPLPEGWTVDQARAALKVRSLYNSFV